MTNKVRIVDVPSGILNVPTMNDWFARERTVTKNAAMSESRTERTWVSLEACSGEGPVALSLGLVPHRVRWKPPYSDHALDDCAGGLIAAPCDGTMVRAATT